MDAIPEERPTPRWVALYELGLLLRTASDRAHPLTAYLAWLTTPAWSRPLDKAQAVLLVTRNPPTDNVRSHSSQAPPSRSATEHIPWPRR